AWWRGDDKDFSKHGLIDGSLRWAAVTVTPTSIGFAGKPLIALTAGRLDGGEAIAPLSRVILDARRIQDSWYEACGDVTRDRPLIVADADVPSNTLVKVLDQLASLRFPRVAMLVGDREPTHPKEKHTDEPAHMVAIQIAGDQVRVMSDNGDRQAAGSLKELESLVAKALDGQRYGCTLLTSQPGGRWAQTTAALDAASAFGSRRNLLVGGVLPSGSASPAIPPRAARTPTEWLALDATVGVLWLDLPTVAFSGTPDAIPCGALVGGGTDTLDLSLGLQAALQTGSPPGASTMARHLTDYGTLVPGPGTPPYSQRALVLASADLEWSIDSETVERLDTAVLACIAEVTDRAAPKTAQVVVGMEIDPTGRVKERWLASTTIPNDPVNNCIVDAWAPLTTAAPLGENRYVLVMVPAVFGAEQPTGTAPTSWLFTADQ
ncbi:MAG: hypothetical protein ACI9MC_003693, partial [Kiritimatiellia bacterium]